MALAIQRYFLVTVIFMAFYGVLQPIILQIFQQ